jgi:hypothetical protein
MDEKSKTLLEVRCCCTPTTLYGYLPIRSDVKAGERITYPIEYGAGFGALTLEVHSFQDAHMQRCLAFKYEGDDVQQKLATLQKIRGFVPA